MITSSIIDDLDRTVEDLLKNELMPHIENVKVSFAAPDSNFHKTITPPAVDLFLYDIRENTELRNAAWIVERQFERDSTTGKITEKAFKQRSPVRVDCSYLITAWSGDGKSQPTEEHLLLSEVMKVLLRHPTIPEVMLKGTLQGQEPPCAALQPGRLQSVGEFWQALGGKPKAALNYTVTIGVVPDRAIKTEVPVVDKRLAFSPSLERS
jgi:hypothetical protein